MIKRLIVLLIFCLAFAQAAQAYFPYFHHRLGCIAAVNPSTGLRTSLAPVALPNLSIPTSNLYSLHRDPGHTYLVETDHLVRPKFRRHLIMRLEGC